MSVQSVTIATGSRLHFGMFAFGDAHQRQFGGVGAMIDTPKLRVRLHRANHWHFAGEHANRAEQIVREFITRHPSFAAGPLMVNIESAPPQHVGLGVGTQLTLSIVAGLAALAGQWPLDAATLAQLAGRAKRSSIGTYGFLHGGLLVDAGKLGNEPIGPLQARLPLPESWRFVLSCPIATEPSPSGRGQGEGIKNIQSAFASSPSGLHGQAEREAFDQLPPVSPQVTRELHALTTERLLPAAQAADCAAFGEALYQFGEIAGRCFAAAQGGSFASPRIAGLVRRLREHGIHAVGQSSWGPTVFSLVPSADAAAKLVAWLGAKWEGTSYRHVIAAPANTGAQIQRE